MRRSTRGDSKTPSQRQAGRATSAGPARAREPEVLDQVVARRFVLVDARGRRRAMLVPYPSGDVILTLSDQDGRVMLALGVDDRGVPCVMLHDRPGHQRMALAVSTRGEPTLTMLDESGTTRLHATLGADGTPSLSLADKAGGRASGSWSPPTGRR